jgi:NodT family efflux transporter outer membrane factor (OMF) lipoprotein
MTLKLSSASFALGWLAACTALPQAGPLEAIDIPSGWSAADAAGAGAPASASLADWWLRFDDPQLAVLVGNALQANTSVLGAVATLQQAQALRDLAAAALWPTLGSSASAQQGIAGSQRTGNNFRMALDANWAIDAFGARRSAVDAGDASAAASQASLGDVQVQIAAEVALNYILLRAAQARSAIARNNLSTQQETLQITLWRQQAGLVTALDADQAQTAVEQNRALLPALQTNIEQTQHALAVLTGHLPAALPELAVVPLAGPAVPQARDSLTLDIPAQALRQRADVRAAEYKVAAALARVSQAQALRWPSFAISGSLGLSAATLGALGNSSAMLANVLASVSLPILDGGALRAQVHLQQAALVQAQQVYRASVLGALQQVEDALVALRRARLRLASLRLAADSADNAALLARQRYGSGLVDFQAVLETRRTLYATQDGVISASADLSSNHIRLFKALGGGWLPAAPGQQP